jgi:phosphatidylglycerol---prolipoprotein diacylglyceryl transferase
MTAPVDPALLRLGPLTIYWYGVLVVGGILLGARVAAYLAQRAGDNPEKIWDVLMFAVVAAIIGARIEYVVVSPHWAYYKDHLAQAFYIWQGGLRIYGAIVGGVLGVLAYARLNRIQPLQLLDYAAPGMAAGHAVGRWGNFINSELYGPPTTLPWGLHIPFELRIAPFNDLTRFPLETRFHPNFLYESIANLLLCVGLVLLADRLRVRLKPGTLVAGYLAGYSVIRFFMDYLRTDYTSAQGLALAFIVASVAFLALRYQPWRSLEKAKAL